MELRRLSPTARALAQPYRHTDDRSARLASCDRCGMSVLNRQDLVSDHQHSRLALSFPASPAVYLQQPHCLHLQKDLPERTDPHRQ